MSDGHAVVVAHLDEHLGGGSVVEGVGDGHRPVDVEQDGFQRSDAADRTFHGFL